MTRPSPGPPFRAACAGLALLAALLSIPVFAADAPAFVVRTRLQPADAVTIGQPATLYVDVFTDLFFTSGIELPTLNVPGAVVKLSDDRPLHISDTINGTSMFGIEHAYSITPIVGSDLAIPAFDVSARAGPQSTLLTATTKSLTLQVSVPEGAEDAFVTHDLTMTQRTDVDVATLKVGDAFTRTVELSASGTPAMFTPVIDLGTATGLRAYPQTPALNDSPSGQPLIGSRIFAVTYVVQQPGDFRLPPVAVKWWDLDTSTIATAQVPALDVHAIAVPPSPAPFEIPSPQPAATAAKPIPWHSVLSIVALAIAAGLLIGWLASTGRRAVKQLEGRLAARRQRHLDSERHAFSELCSALQCNDASAISRSLYRWLDRLPRARSSRAPTVRDIDSLSGMARWLDAHYTGQAAAPTSQLIDELRAARRRILRKTPQSPDARRLSALNP